MQRAAQLLEEATSPAALRPLAAAIGFAAPPLALPRPTRQQLGLAPHLRTAAICHGGGPLRLLIGDLQDRAAGEFPEDAPTPVTPRAIRQIAQALLRSAPQQRWCLLLRNPSHDRLILAAITMGNRGADIAALHVDRHRIVASDADTLKRAAAIDRADPLAWHQRLVDLLQRDALSSRFYSALDQAVTRLATSLNPAPRSRQSTAPSARERRELAVTCASRTLFLAFLEAKGWLDNRHDFLLQELARTVGANRSLHANLLAPLFFGTLNTPRKQRAAIARAFGTIPFLNGGLFSPTPLERRWHRWHFSDAAITHLVTDIIGRYRFTSREQAQDWSEVAIDPEMLGRAFEGLMAPADRKRSGTFYTPPALVDAIVSEALDTHGLPATAAAAAQLPPADRAALPQRIFALRALDSACGSGACLVHLLERLDALLEAAGDTRPAQTRRRALLCDVIFGVDREPLAVWLCELRLWLAVVVSAADGIESPVLPLPNLDHHIHVGDALTGGHFTAAPPPARTLATLRARYTRASGARKRHAAVALDQEERRRAVDDCTRCLDDVHHQRRLLISALRTRDLFGTRPRLDRSHRAQLHALRHRQRTLRQERLRLTRGGALPFRFASTFADVAATGGFSLIIGNPPWVRPHALPTETRLALKHEFASMRAPSWLPGATQAGAGPGFAAQPDLAVAFVERALHLLAPNGTLALLVPAKLWRTLSGAGLRREVATQAQLRRLHDWSDAPPQFDAATYPSLLVAQRRTSTTSAPATRAIDDARETRITVVRNQAHVWTTPHESLPLDRDAAAPWIFLPPDARQSFNALRGAGTPLALSPLKHPRLGVKCGCNSAFLVHATEHDDEGATISTIAGPDIRQAVIERHLLRPVLRGEDVGRLTAVPHGPTHDTLRLIYPHDPLGTPLRTLPPRTARWLAHWRPRLETRRDARPHHPWWTLFRTDAARFTHPRVVWADIGRRLRTTVLTDGDPTIPLNSCYLLPTASLDEAYALDTLLTSTLVAAWLDPLAEPARGHYRRFLGWTIASLPIPLDWPRAIARLAPIGKARSTGTPPPPDVIDSAILDCYGLSADTVAPLLAWYATCTSTTTR